MISMEKRLFRSPLMVVVGFHGQFIEELQPGATVVEDGLSISRNHVPEAQNDVASWVRYALMTEKYE